MGSKFTLMRTMVATTVVGGALVLGTAGAAGASAPTLTATPGTSAAATHLTPAAKALLPHFSCTHATKALTRIQKLEARIAAGLPKLNRIQAKASAAGETQKAARIGRVITRLERPVATARLQRLAANIEAKCNVAAPTVVPNPAR